ncbi:unnamed protein product [Calicophoron daubneyi]|uniref:Protein LTV1 homolog n=1 Tax=Calicophoron daubneyi TaxID=300641 RepID=A0AAV2TWV7_CALDB
MKKAGRRDFRPCALEPVERKPRVPLPGVPEHFNYGVFFDDDYDYMQHLKSATEFNERAEYKIVGIPEDEELKTDEPDSVGENLREPEVDPDNSVPDDLGLNSDAEQLSEYSEIEDDFIELAGGHKVVDSEEVCGENGDLEADGQAKHPRDLLPKDKVLMMERFLYGDNEQNVSEEELTSSSEDLEYPDEETIDSRQFEKLLMKCKNRANSASQSVVTGTSLMSEGLQYALSRDSRLLSKQHVKTDDLGELDNDVKQRTVAYESRLGDEVHSSGDSDLVQSDEDEERPKEIMDITTFSGQENNCRPNFDLLVIPRKSKSFCCSKNVSMEDLNSGNTNCISSAHSTVPDPSTVVRKKGESAEEKRMRKALVKQQRRERRKIRKANQLNFRLEHERELNAGVRMLSIS